MDPRHTQSLRIQSSVIFWLLIVQYFLGTYVTLFVQFPANVTSAQLWAFAWLQPALVAHIVIGIVLLIGAIVFCALAFAYKDPVWRKFSVIGLLAILFSIGIGAKFIPTQDNTYSYLMAFTFLIALVTYGWGLFVVHKAGEAAMGPTAAPQ